MNSLDIKFAVLSFHCRAIDDLSLPVYKGSTLRGAFGFTFRRVVCITKLPVCDECMFKTTCSYSYVFETPDLSGEPGNAKRGAFEPHPFVIEPPLETNQFYRAGEELCFHLILIGKAVDYLPYFIFTFEEMGRRGIGRGRGRYKLEKACSGFHLSDGAEQQVIYNGDKRLLAGTPPTWDYDRETAALASQTVSSPLQQVTVRFLTPARIKAQDRLTIDVDFDILVRALLRRISMLSKLHCNQDVFVDYRKMLSDAREVRTISSRLTWHDWERYSNRQQTRLKMGGIRGEITFSGDLTQFLPLLILGKYLHVGKGTVYGLGKYELNWPSNTLVVSD